MVGTTGPVGVDAVLERKSCQRAHWCSTFSRADKRGCKKNGPPQMATGIHVRVATCVSVTGRQVSPGAHALKRFGRGSVSQRVGAQKTVNCSDESAVSCRGVVWLGGNLNEQTTKKTRGLALM